MSNGKTHKVYAGTPGAVGSPTPSDVGEGPSVTGATVGETQKATGEGSRRGRSRCYDKPVWTVAKLGRFLPSLPGHLVRALSTLWRRDVDNALREAIMLAVAAENRSRYCLRAHSILGRLSGLDPTEIASLVTRHRVGRRPGEKAALDYGRDLARRGFAGRNDDLWSEVSSALGPEGAKTVHSVAALMNMFNRFGNTFDAALNKALGGCVETEASAIDMAVLSAMYVPVALLVAPVFGALEAGLRLYDRFPGVHPGW